MNRSFLIRIIPIIVIAGIVFNGCAVGPDFQKPETETPEYFFNYDSLEVDTLVNLKWWEIFNDPVLDTIVVTALRENRNVNIAIARIEEARASLGFTEADIYPRLDIQGGAARGNFNGGLKFDSETNNFFIAPVVNWEIDFWGKFRRATESAQAEYLASEFSLRTIQISLITEVVSTIFYCLTIEIDLKFPRKLSIPVLKASE